MIISYSHDGQPVDKKWLIQEGFAVNEDRDFRKKYVRQSQTGDPTDEYQNVFDFVGFLVNSNNNVFTVFPKNYQVIDIEKDSAQLFNVISKHIQRRPDKYIGKKYGKKYESNYPFAAFFGIYNHFVKFGLYFEDKVFLKPNSGGKINWKKTVRLSKKYISNGKLTFFPIYYEKKYYFSVFLTECMIFAIDYTIDKFGSFINLRKTGRPFPNFDFINGKEFVLENLYNLRQYTFKDSLIALIDNLINFFSSLNIGGNYYFKHYSFSSIWEDMVNHYLKYNFSEIRNNQIIFDRSTARKSDFKKVAFHPNIANKSHYFEPDYYFAENDTQLIFDAKYYTNLQGIDYKQIAYFLFLKEYREKLNSKPKYSKTYSALILPSETRMSKIHFKMDPIFNKSNQDIVILEEYLDIRDVMENYLNLV